MADSLDRRAFLRLAAAGAAGAALNGCASGASPKSRVVVIGGGFGGATAAKYLRMWDPSVDVVLVERNERFTSCPLSNLVVGGSRTLADISRSYAGLSRYGVHVLRDEVVAIDPDKQQVRLARGAALPYDRVIVSPGVDFLFDELPNYRRAMDEGRILHAWKAGPQTLALRGQLEAMRNGGVFVISIPPTPYRCPPAPYERACQVAAYFKRAKPRSKILIVDANPDLTSKGALFRRAWSELYPGMIEYRPNNTAVDVDAKTMTVKLELEDVTGDVLNVIPPQRAGDIAQKAGLITANKRWCGVAWRSLESVAVPNIHVLGDATLSAPAMAKSGHMANQHGKVAAAAVSALLSGRPINPAPVMSNTCYSFVSERESVHVASIHAWDDKAATIVPVHGTSGVSAKRSEIEGEYGWSWAQNIWADMLD